MLSFGITLTVATLSYLAGTKYNWNRNRIKMLKEEIEEWKHYHTVMKGKYSSLKRQYDAPEEAFTGPGHENVGESVHVLLGMLPTKWKALVQPFETEIIKEISKPENEKKIRDAIAGIAKKQGNGKAEEEKVIDAI